jgi:uncharacterized glyoxalase superfamily protein PhnB
MVKNPPEGMPRITPYLFYNDVKAASDWLSKAFGFTQRMEMPGPDGAIMHAEMTLHEALVMMGLASEEQGSKSPAQLDGINQSLYIYVDDLEAHCRQAQAAGAEITSEITQMFWGDKMYVAKDLEGHRWTFAQHVKDVAPEDMKPDFS